MLPPVFLGKAVPVGAGFRGNHVYNRNGAANSPHPRSAHARKSRPKRPRRKLNASSRHRPPMNAKIWWSPMMKKASLKALTFTTSDPFAGNGCPPKRVVRGFRKMGRQLERDSARVQASVFDFGGVNTGKSPEAVSMHQLGSRLPG